MKTTPRSVPLQATTSRRVRLCAAGPCGALLLLALSVLPAAGDGYSMPPAVPDRIGRAQIFDYGVKDRSALLGKRDIIWGDGGPKVPGLYTLHYMMVDRDPDKTHDLTWYQTNHPDWVVYQKDHKTVANEF